MCRWKHHRVPMKTGKRETGNLHVAKRRFAYCKLAICILQIFHCSLLAFALSGCSSTRTVTMPERHESVAHQRDSFSLRDSIFVYDSVLVVFRGDTVLKHEFHTVYRDRWRNVVRTDSFVQRDTVTVVVEVEKPTAGRRKLNPFIAGMIVVLVAYVFIRKIYNKRAEK